MRLRLAPALAAVALAACTLTAHASGLVTGIDGMTSTVMQQHQSSFSGLGLRVRLHPASLTQQIDLMPSIEYWRNSSTVSPYNIHTARRDATLAMDARYRFETRGWKPFIGAGFGLHFLSNEVEAPLLGVPRTESSTIKGGLSLMGGLTFPMTARVDNFIELKYHHLPGEAQFKINWGLAVGL